MGRPAIAISVAAVGIAVITSACGASTNSDTNIDVSSATNGLWDPCALSVDAVHQMGMDPTTKHPDSYEARHAQGDKQCTWHDTTPAYNYDVTIASSIYSTDDLRKDRQNTDFTRVDIAGRSGIRFDVASDTHGDECDLAFPSNLGRYRITVERHAANATLAPCAEASAVATAVAPLLPL